VPQAFLGAAVEVLDESELSDELFEVEVDDEDDEPLEV
jgi:hypothetical protein